MPPTEPTPEPEPEPEPTTFLVFTQPNATVSQSKARRPTCVLPGPAWSYLPDPARCIALNLETASQIFVAFNFSEEWQLTNDCGQPPDP